MTHPVLLQHRQKWQCPSCGLRDETTKPMTPTAAQYHACPQQQGLHVRLVRVDRYDQLAGQVHHRPIQREDYSNGDVGLTRHDKLGVVSAVHTERADGSHDTNVMPGMARITPQEWEEYRATR